MNYLHCKKKLAICRLIAYTVLAPEIAVARPDLHSMVALGDSVTTGFDAEGIFDNLQFSWATGNSTDPRLVSHYSRLKQIMAPSEVQTENMASAGSLVAETLTQAHHMQTSQPDYVTILSGANDVCTWTHTAEEELPNFKQHLLETIDYLTSTSPDVKILLVPIPNMAEIYPLGILNSCQEKWSIFNICQKLLSPSNSEMDRQIFLNDVEKVNLAIYDVAQTRPLNVKFAAGVDHAILTAEHISKIDCFHPSVAGQNYLAKLTWESGWFRF
jgi:lysophospholipase L1-like esterase